MNKLIEEILPDIETVVNHTTKDYNDRHEITQTLILKLYDNKKQVKKLHKDGDLKRWMYTVCYRIKMDLFRARKYVSLGIDIPDEAEEGKSLNGIDTVKTLDEMLRQLNHVERIWMNIYLESGQSFREVSRRTTICRLKVTERIKTILEKWKHLDIYLEQ